MAKIEIFTSDRCGWAVRNYSALIEKGVEFELVAAYDGAGAKRDEFLNLTPYAKTPILRHGELVVIETLLINEYIEDAFPEPSLMPKAAQLRAEAKKWMHYCDSHLIPAIAGVCTLNEDAERNTALDTAAQRFEYLDKAAMGLRSGSPYFFGDQLTLVDLCYSTLFGLLSSMRDDAGEEIIIYSTRFAEWRDAVLNRPSVVEAMEIVKRAPPVDGELQIQAGSAI